MSLMDGNPHYEIALSPVTLHHDSPEQELAGLQIEATLALAFEQRTANLIAIYGQVLHLLASGGNLDGQGVDQMHSLKGKIESRLGLDTK